MKKEFSVVRIEKNTLDLVRRIGDEIKMSPPKVLDLAVDTFILSHPNLFKLMVDKSERSSGE
jgi:hypothetical protein